MLRAPNSQRSAARGAFTLIELMVVILIIGILVSLVAAAVALGLTKGKQTRNRTEIAQLQEAIEQFKQRFGTYPPSRMLLGRNNADYTTSQLATQNPQLAQDSQAILSTMFPRIDWTGASGIFNWDGQGMPNGPVILEGDQCLVFFLGGIPSIISGQTPTFQGFSTNPKNPTLLTSGGTVNGPFFEFYNNRLVTLTHTNTGGTASFLSYLDNYGLSDGMGGIKAGLPYAYFSSYKVRNGYNRYLSASSTSDCSTIGGGVWPYAQSGPTTSQPTVLLVYWNPSTFQIVAPGADGLFGSGSVPASNGTFSFYWTPQTAANIYPKNPQQSPGYDDQSNFTGSILGVGQD